MQVHSQMVRQLLQLIPHAERGEHKALIKQAEAFVKENDVLEEMGTHQVNTVVHFCPEGAARFRAKVMRAYGTPNGKVFYDVALAHVDKDGVESFAEKMPIRDVSPYYIFTAFDQERSKDVGTDPQAVRRVFSLDTGNVAPEVAVAKVQEIFDRNDEGAGDKSFALAP